MWMVMDGTGKGLIGIAVGVVDRLEGVGGGCKILVFKIILMFNQK